MEYGKLLEIVENYWKDKLLNRVHNLFTGNCLASQWMRLACPAPCQKKTTLILPVHMSTELIANHVI